MLLAPFTLSDPALRPRHAQPARAHVLTAWLTLWFAAGSLLWLLVPGLTRSAVAGYSLPFWLVGAPLLNMLWLQRWRLATLLHERFRRRRTRR